VGILPNMDVANEQKSTVRAVATRICLTCHRQFHDDAVMHCPTDGTLLIVPNVDPLARSPLAEQYQVDGVIGSGGWSLVYRAKQVALGRDVAVKILHSHLVFDPDKVRRFQREAEALSQFNCPAIPTVYDFGQLPSGQPYMIMAYVHGRSLSQIIAEDGPMPIATALDIFAQAAAGLYVAHERGIIHRDIKPSNILLTSDKHEVKILDFGLAKLIDAGEGETLATLTQAGHTIGTPAYMSPEQCLGIKLDARSDIYSLGCVMYESITGVCAFDGKDAFEAMSNHMRGDISFENTKLKDTIPDSVEQLILRTLAKNPADRFQTAKELSTAIEAIQSQAAFNRSPFRFVYVLKRLALQHKGNIASAATTLATTVLIIGALLFTAMRSVDFMNTNAHGVVQHNMSDTYKDSMAKGERQLYAGNYSSATKYFREAAEIAENFGAADERLTSSLKRLRECLLKDNRNAEAEKVTQHMEALKNSTYGLMYGTPEQNAREIMSLTTQREEHPQDVELARKLCAVLNNQAALMFTQSNIEDAKQFLDRAMAIEKKTLGEKDPEYATTLSNLAYYEAHRGDKTKAEDLYKQSLELRKKILGAGDPKVGRSLRNLGDFYWQKGDVQKAQELMTQSMEVYRKQLPKTAADYAWTVNNLGLIYASQKNYPQARKSFNEALELRKQLYGPDGLDVGRTIHNLAQLDTAEQKYADAEEEFRTAQRIYDTKLGTDHDDSLKCVSNLANLYVSQHNYADAEPLLKRIFGILKDKKPNDPMFARAHELLVQIYTEQGRKDALKEVEITHTGI
jgi:tetratricopeptide (TPR) repeat protein/predicted Ser/Thr protein kinase